MKETKLNNADTRAQGCMPARWQMFLTTMAPFRFLSSQHSALLAWLVLGCQQLPILVLVVGVTRRSSFVEWCFISHCVLEKRNRIISDARSKQVHSIYQQAENLSWEYLAIFVAPGQQGPAWLRHPPHHLAAQNSTILPKKYSFHAAAGKIGTRRRWKGITSADAVAADLAETRCCRRLLFVAARRIVVVLRTSARCWRKCCWR